MSRALVIGAIIASFALCATLLAAALPSHAVAPATRTFSSVDFLISASATPPSDTAPWQSLTLPDHWNERRPDTFGTAWYRVGLTLAQVPEEPWLVYLPRLRDGGRVFVNGALAASVTQADATRFVQWLRPQALMIPPGMLVAGENTLHIRIAVTQPMHRMVEFFVGPESELMPRYQWRMFWSHTSAQTTVIGTVSLGLFVLVIWIRRRMAFDYGLFGLASLCWGLRTLTVVIAVYPIRVWHWWNVFYYATTGGFVVCMTLFMLRFAGLHHRAVEHALIAYWLTGPLLLALGGPGWDPAVSRFYQGGLVAVSTIMLSATAYVGWRRRTPGVLLLCVGVVFGLALGVHDYLIAIGVLDYRRPYLLHLSAIVLLGAVGAQLADRFVRSMREVEQASEVLESTVRRREHELELNYDRLRRLERERVLSDERQRIMQDMHDGLGSQLLSSLAMVERGALDREGMAQTLREAIDDMRLAIDTLDPGHEGLVEAMANLAWRLQPRFRAAGIELRLHLDETPDRIEMPAEYALQILRILQEALANALKHSGAHSVNVFVSLHDDPRSLELRVHDDGSGIDSGTARSGRGLTGMQRRAARIGATLRVDTPRTGTAVSLMVPLARVPAAAAPAPTPAPPPAPAPATPPRIRNPRDASETGTAAPK